MSKKTKKRFEEGKIIEIETEEEYERFKKDGLVIVDYNTNWCGPCKNFAPVYEELAKSYPQTKFLSVDAEGFEHPDLEIRTVPTFRIFFNGKLKREFAGVDKERLEKYIKRYQIQIFYKEETQREFSNELSAQVTEFMEKYIPFQILINGKVQHEFTKEIKDLIIEYMKEFPSK